MRRRFLLRCTPLAHLDCYTKSRHPWPWGKPHEGAALRRGKRLGRRARPTLRRRSSGDGSVPLRIADTRHRRVLGADTGDRLGINVGLHHLFSHHSFATFAPIEWALMILGGMA